MDFRLDMAGYAAMARRAVAEGCVLIKNENEALPLKKKDKVAVFGRMAHHYYKSGLGSGGLVNTRYVVGILDALKNEDGITLSEKLLNTYEAWIEEHPYDEGKGWGQVPWNQEEMILTDEIVSEAADCDAAIVIIGRTAGEDQDNAAEPGQYLLTEKECLMLEKVCSTFKRTAVVLNVGNIIDMKWVEKYNVPAVLYVWQGGQEGGNGVCDVLMGRVNPCGRLTDTIAYDINDYPSASCFGDEIKNFYKEDIYVGYRYFETFARDRVMYPFGYGLSYTSFSIEQTSFRQTGDGITIGISVTNTGNASGREVVQIYINAPQGVLGKPSRLLAAYGKTQLLEGGDSEELELTIPYYTFASFDDSGITGHKNAYVLEAGTYGVYAGENVRSAEKTAEFELEERVIEQLEEAYAPAESFERMKPVVQGTDYQVSFEPVPVRSFGAYDRMERPEELAYTGDMGYKLADVYDGRVAMEDFIAQLTKEDLVCLFRGEGMCSPKVTPGCASAFGGLTEELRHFGIPAACTADGPSGIRMDVGSKAFSLPNGTLLGCTFDDKLVEALYRFTGRELRRNRIDSILGPGLNIHRNPLNGRNFEYISEDPLLTGRIGAAQLRGLSDAGSTGTIKHFVANNQEKKRHSVNSIVSQRALREIYLKGFEIAVKEGNAKSVMTTYGPVNGIWTAGSNDLNTLILRKEWGFDGVVMTDWWAIGNYEGENGNSRVHAPMVSAGNDLFMVCQDAADHAQDDVMEKLAEGFVTTGQLQRNASHILGFILKSPAMLYEMDLISEEELEERKLSLQDDIDYEALSFYDAENDSAVIDGSDFDTRQGSNVLFGVNMKSECHYDIEIFATSELGELAQLPVSVFMDNVIKSSLSFRGSNGVMSSMTGDIGYVRGITHYIRLYFGATGLKVDKVVIRKRN